MFGVEAEREGVLFVNALPRVVMRGVRLGSLVTITKYWSTDNVNRAFCKSEFHDVVKREF